MKSRLRKLALTFHIILSVGWLGAVAGFVALNVLALNGQNARAILSAYIGMEVVAQRIILPLCFGSLFTGLIQSIGTQWGILKHYWIAVKFFLTVGSTILLLVHMRLISDGAAIAAETIVPNAKLNSIGSELLQKSILALLVLIIVTTISIYKPWGKIRSFGKSNNKAVVMENKSERKSSSLKIIIGCVIVSIILFAIWHLSGKMNHH
jgi:hypothetical protein